MRKAQSLILVAILLISLVFQIVAVSGAGETVDSFLHTANAKSLAGGGQNEYDRAAFYTYLLATSFKLFGVNNFSLYFPNILANLAIISVIYFLGRKIFNLETAVAGSILYALSPWSIGEAANIRMYVLFSLLSFLFFYTFYRFLFATKIFKEKGVHFWQVICRKWPYLLIIFSFLLAAYHLHDLAGLHFLTFILFLPIALIIFIISDARKNQTFQTSERTDNILYFLLYLNLFIGILFIFWPDPIGQIESNLKWQSAALANLKGFSESPRNGLGWFLGLYRPWILYSSLLIFLFYSVWTKKLNHFFWWLAFAGPALASFLLINRYFSPRYFFFLLPILSLVIGYSIYIPLSFFIKKQSLKLAAIFLVVFLITPWPKIAQALKFKNGENLNQELYYDFEGIIKKTKIESKDVLIETSFGPFGFYQNESKNIVNLSRLELDGSGTEIPIEDVERKFFKAILSYEQGYFLTDYYRFEKWPCAEYVPCSVREYVIGHPEIFTPITHTADPNLLLFKFERKEPSGGP